MDYSALPQATIIKLMWALFPMIVITFSCIVNPSLSVLFSDPVISVMIVCFPIPRIIQIIRSHRSQLHLDDRVVRLTGSNGVTEICWCDADAIQIREKIRWFSEKRVIYVREDEATIIYYISDLDPADQKAIKRQVERQPHYQHIKL